MDIAVGTSGFSYKEWKPSFYPADLPAARMLGFYADRLATVEINNTFYRMPTDKAVLGWASEVPSGFTFALKAPQRITHQRRLKDAGETAQAFVRVAEALGDKLGPLLFQLPPNMKKDAARLAGFLAELPAGRRVAFEFRHDSWFDEETYDVLQKHGAALCTAEGEGLASPLVPTAGWGYLRLRLGTYTDEAIEAWAARVRAAPWGSVFVYFKHDEGQAPALAAKMIARLRPAGGGAGGA